MTHLNSRLTLDEGVKVTVPLSVTSISCPKRGTEQAVRKRAINVLTILFIYCFVSRLKVRFVRQITAGRHLLFSLMIKSQMCDSTQRICLHTFKGYFHRFDKSIPVKL